MTSARAFVSHSQHDNTWCREFVVALQAAGWDVWFEEQERSADPDWVATTRREVQARELFLFVPTPAAWDSTWVQEELSLAIATHRKIVLVLHLENRVLSGFLLHRQWVMVYDLSATDAARKVLQTVAMPASTPTALPTSAVSADWASMPLLGPAPTPQEATPADHLTPTSLYSLGFRGYTLGNIECIVPPLCSVAGGVFTMGSDKSHDPYAGAYDDEIPQHPVAVASFALGQHPVTVAEYACAVHAGAVPEPYPLTYFRGRLVDWQMQLTHLDHPVVCVSWHEAIAYIRWLAETTGQSWRLLTEAEWEKAARWDPERQVGSTYPWGETFDNSRCNTSESEIETTTPVGTYPHGASPLGVQDMGGNVRQWTSSLFKPYPYVVSDGREDLDAFENRVLRGGSWHTRARDARAAYRYDLIANLFDVNIGFRLAFAPGGS